MQGQFRVNFSVSSQEADRRDILLLALQKLSKKFHEEQIQRKLNEIRCRQQLGIPEDDEEDDEEDCNFGGFFSNSLYGNNSSTTSSRQLEKANTIDSQKIFTSVQALAVETGLSRLEVTRGLYMLQQRGMISYNLSQPAFFANIHTSVCDEYANLSYDNYFDKIWSLSQVIFDFLERICSTSVSKSLEMWKLGKILSDPIHHGHHDLDNKEMLDFQLSFREMLCECMSTTAASSGIETRKSSIINNVTPASESHCTIQDGNGLLKIYNQLQYSYPSSCLLPISASSNSNKLEPNFVRDVASVVLDSRLQMIVMGICVVGTGSHRPIDPSFQPTSSSSSSMRHAPHQTANGRFNHTSNRTAEIVPAQKSKVSDNSRLLPLKEITEFMKFLHKSKVVVGTTGDGRQMEQSGLLLQIIETLSLLTSKILHGLPTKLIPLAHWGDHGAWGRYHEVDFQEIQASVASCPSTKQVAIAIAKSILRL